MTGSDEYLGGSGSTQIQPETSTALVVLAAAAAFGGGGQGGFGGGGFGGGGFGGMAASAAAVALVAAVAAAWRRRWRFCGRCLRSRIESEIANIDITPPEMKKTCYG
ncbi:MAG: hypothetical protein R2688_06265 [Fimbriimonadaceae bacterium]